MILPFKIGKYLVSPLVRENHPGSYAAAVSIRSGHSSQTHDRLMRFTSVFHSAEEAARYSASEGVKYVRTRLQAALNA